MAASLRQFIIPLSIRPLFFLWLYSKGHYFESNHLLPPPKIIQQAIDEFFELQTGAHHFDSIQSHPK